MENARCAGGGRNGHCDRRMKLLRSKRSTRDWVADSLSLMPDINSLHRELIAYSFAFFFSASTMSSFSQVNVPFLPGVRPKWP